ncbi:hypothetical protein DSO57_1009991 [Entomophthora muscae]|uniref:Uncharacterized protein n=1 Tax=Entomophthora muscae TaxID=34485 RepID=A0ACC2RLA8_9FUNG|nr:hypothetical protein DSO57_1009991 [Entomophthora muscae]
MDFRITAFLGPNFSKVRFHPNPVVATEFPSSPPNVSYDAQGVLDEPPLDVSNSMDQSDGNIKLQALPPN